MRARNLPELGLMATNQLDLFCRDISCYAANALGTLRKVEDILSADDILSDKLADYLENCRGDIRGICHIVNEKV